jgi:hypothetical protein
MDETTPDLCSMVEQRNAKLLFPCEQGVQMTKLALGELALRRVRIELFSEGESARACSKY